MPSWKGDPNNPAPNNDHEAINRSEKIIDDNRATHVRRDNDQQKDFTISLYDIDETILDHLNRLQLQVTDTGKQVSVPVFYGSPERWSSAQQYGYMRDNQGKIILPAMILKRTSSDKNPDLQYFNRYLNSTAMRLFTPKNKYTKFAIQAGQSAPVSEVYNVVFPSHMILTYHCIIWTQLIEQMNPLVESIQFNTKDYWGTKDGFRFRTRTEAFGHTVEIEANEDRVVKTEFDLITYGYILPDTMTKLEKHQLTTNKKFTPKKIVMGAEVVSSDFNMDTLDSNKEKWRNPNYPNLQKDVPIPVPPVTMVDSTKDPSIAIEIVNTLKSVTQSTMVDPILLGVDNAKPFLRIVPRPHDMAAGGEEGNVSYDDKYFYIYTGGRWRRVAIGEFSSLPGQEGDVSFNNQYFYLYSKGAWRQVAIAEFT